MEKFCWDLFRKGFSTPHKKLDGQKSRHKALAPPNKMSAQYFQSFCLIISTLFDTEDMSTTFRRSCIHGNIHVVDILTELFDDEIKDSKLIGLHKACQTNKFAIVERLVNSEYGISHVLVFACENGHLELLEQCLRYDKVVILEDFEDYIQYYPRSYLLNTACEKGHLAIVDRLLQDDRIDPTWEDTDFPETALSIACVNGHIAIVERLLQDSRIDPGIHDNFTITGMTWNSEAPSSTKIEIMNLLTENDNVNLLDNDNYFGFNALSGIFISGDITVARWLFNEYGFQEQDFNKAFIIARNECLNGGETRSIKFEDAMEKIKRVYDDCRLSDPQ